MGQSMFQAPYATPYAKYTPHLKGVIHASPLFQIAL